MKYDLIIFDGDGTLIDSFNWFVKTLFLASERFGFKCPDDAQIPFLRQLHTKEILKELGVKIWKTPQIAIFFREQMLKDQKEIHPFPPVFQTISSLRKLNCRLALASSNSLENLNTILGQTIMSQFHTIKTGSSLFGKHFKLKEILKEQKTSPENALYIADETRDCLSAQKINLPFGLATWGYQEPKAFENLKVNHSFKDFSEIITLIKNQSN